MLMILFGLEQWGQSIVYGTPTFEQKLFDPEYHTYTPQGIERDPRCRDLDEHTKMKHTQNQVSFFQSRWWVQCR